VILVAALSFLAGALLGGAGVAFLVGHSLSVLLSNPLKR
jgi:hypothetical protein